MSTAYLSNEQILLRAADPEDLDVMYRMENSPLLWEVSNSVSPYSRFVLKQYLENTTNDIYTDKQLRLMIVRQSDKEVLGVIDLTDYVPLHERAAIGIALFDEYRKQGFASQALQLLIDYAFGHLAMKQLYVHIPVDNEASLQLFQQFSFCQSGILKKWIRSGDSYKDVVIMQRFR
ncbi:N-acetyltransferase [Bacteroides sp. 214]|uniref:GNAT family N-acetyltransferase n=1 Tax=Bacteroides sp. 214 TaxID=2302935 RepID=UPI0013D44776|nr:GNAT family N-acetyltransferase [Bacteroides sp. 214]NDW11591.1 N-acetyltransferase [Bacteroides sp. 214]